MKKILLLADINSSHTQKWATAIAASGWGVYIFGLHAVKSDWFSEKDIEVRSFGLNANVASSSMLGKLKYFKAKKEVQKFAAEVNPDIVHAHYASSYGMLAKLVKIRPLVVSLWGSETYDFPQKSSIHRLFFKWIIKYPDIICSTSKDMAEVCKSFVNRPIEIIPFGIDTTHFKSKKENLNNVFTIGTVKSLEAVYGIDRLLRAYASFRKKSNRPSQLFIYGSGSQEAELKQLAIDLNIDEHTYFKGFVSGDDLLSAYDSLDIYCALSLRESFGVAVLEAQSMGLPVIVSDAGGLKEVLQDGVTGYIIENGDSEKAASKMDVLSASSERKEMGGKARQFVIDNFDFQKNLNNQLRIYDELIANKK